MGEKSTTFGDVAGAINPIIGMALNAATADSQDRRQIRQQTKLQDLQVKGAKELGEFNRKQQMQMWHDTNWSAQLNEARKAGMSVSALLGGQGAGGASMGGEAGNVSGGQAANAASTQSANTENAMAIAQMQNIQANTEKTKAETENIGGVVKENTAADTASKVWTTELSKKLNSDTFIKDIQDQQKWAEQKIELQFQKENAEWEAAKAGGFEGKAFDDPESPVAKAIKAGYQKTITEAENAKKTGNVLRAETAIKEFEARLTKQGIAAGSPWYVKIMADMLGKIGINLTGDTASAVKDTAKKLK